MGAQTRHSLDQARSILAKSTSMTVELASELFQGAMGLSGSAALRQALADSAASTDRRQVLANQAFASLSTDAKKLVEALVDMRWSHPEDIQAALEDLAIRVCAGSAQPDTDLVGELLAISGVVHQDPELELTLGSKRASAEGKVSLLTALLGKKVSAEALAIVSHLVSDPRGRRIGAMLQNAAQTVADHHGKGLAVVTAAKALSAKQSQTVDEMLASRYGRDHYLALVINPDVVGGLKIRVGDDVIDGSIATRLHDLRVQLAG